MTDDEKEARALVAGLVAIRKRKKMTQKEVAEKLFMCRSGLSHFENFRRNPHLITVMRYAKAIGVELIYWEKIHVGTAVALLQAHMEACR